MGYKKILDNHVFIEMQSEQNSKRYIIPKMVAFPVVERNGSPVSKELENELKDLFSSNLRNDRYLSYDDDCEVKETESLLSEPADKTYLGYCANIYIKFISQGYNSSKRNYFQKFLPYLQYAIYQNNYDYRTIMTGIDNFNLTNAKLFLWEIAKAKMVLMRETYEDQYEQLLPRLKKLLQPHFRSFDQDTLTILGNYPVFHFND